MDEERRRIAAKYDRSTSTYSSRYADPGAYADFFIKLIESWAVPIRSGASILEISCADGFMTEILLRYGYQVTGVDLSPRMVDATRARLAENGLDADLRVADVNAFEPDRTWDVLLAPMATFYHYVDDPRATLSRLALAVTTKVIVDLNPREQDASEGMRDLADAGFPITGSRPVYVPISLRIGTVGRWTLRTVGAIPPVRTGLLRRKFNVAIMGARRTNPAYGDPS